MVNATIEVDCDGKTLEKLKECIEERNRMLKQETAPQSVFATVNQILRSLRAGTKVADPNVNICTIEPITYLVSSWKTVGKVRMRCLRRGNQKGPIVEDAKAIFLVGKYVKGEKPIVWYVTDRVTKELNYNYFLIGDDEKKAREYAKNRMEKRINKFKGMAKFVLSYATRVVAQNGNLDPTTGAAKKVGVQNLVVDMKTGGWNDGYVEVTVEDNLDYATSALKDGTTVETAIQKACNSTIGMINRKLDLPITEKIPAPFPDIQKR